MKEFPAHIVAVDGIIENESGEILLVKQRNKQIWAIPGGQVEIGENLTDALIREIKEESGFDATVDKLICVSSNTGSYQGYGGYGIVPTKGIFGFICTFAGGEPRTSDETDEVRWIPKSEVLNYITAPPLRKRFESYLEFDGKNIQYLEYVSRPEYELKSERHF